MSGFIEEYPKVGRLATDDILRRIVELRDNDIIEYRRLTAALQSGTPEYTITNATEDRAFDADSTTTAELADVLGTLIADLQEKGVIG